MCLDEPTKPESTHGGAETHRKARRGRVLVVDDEPNVRLVFRAALESDGFLVEEASDGAAALNRLGRSSCDIVLLDLKMPGVDGMEVLRQLRDGGNEVPVVIVTAHGTNPDAVAAMELGAFDVLFKPLTPDVLRRVVSDVIERHALAGLAPDNPRINPAAGP